MLPPPRAIDHSDIFPGVTFNLNLCWQVHEADAASLEAFWSYSSAAGPWWALH